MNSFTALVMFFLALLAPPRLGDFDQRARHGEPYIPVGAVKNCPQRVEYLLSNVIRPIEEKLRIRLHVTSGYRSPSYNKKVGGAKDSRHKHCDAADVIVSGRTTFWVYRKVYKMWKDGEIPALGGLGIYKTHVHLDARPHKPGELVRWDKR